MMAYKQVNVNQPKIIINRLCITLAHHTVYRLNYVSNKYKQTGPSLLIIFSVLIAEKNEKKKT